MAPIALCLALGTVAGGCDDGGGDRDAYCATAERFAADNPADAFGRIDLGDPAATSTVLRDAAERLAAWADEAPGAVDDDVEVLVEAATTLADQFDDLATRGGDPGSTIDVDLAAVEASSRRVVDFTRTECGVELDVPVSVSG